MSLRISQIWLFDILKLSVATKYVWHILHCFSTLGHRKKLMLGKQLVSMSKVLTSEQTNICPIVKRETAPANFQAICFFFWY